MSDIIDDGFAENKGIALLQIEPRKKFLVISIISGFITYEYV